MALALREDDKEQLLNLLTARQALAGEAARPPVAPSPPLAEVIAPFKDEAEKAREHRRQQMEVFEKNPQALKSFGDMYRDTFKQSTSGKEALPLSEESHAEISSRAEKQFAPRRESLAGLRGYLEKYLGTVTPKLNLRSLKTLADQWGGKKTYGEDTTPGANELSANVVKLRGDLEDKDLALEKEISDYKKDQLTSSMTTGNTLENMMALQNALKSPSGDDEYKKRKDRLNMEQDLLHDWDRYSKPKQEALLAAEQAKSYLQQGLAPGAEMYKTMVAKSADSRVSDADIKRLAANPSVGRTLERAWKKLTTGTLTDADTADYEVLVKAQIAKTDEVLKEMSSYFAKQRGRAYGLTPPQVTQLIFPDMGFSFQSAPPKKAAPKSEDAAFEEFAKKMLQQKLKQKVGK